MARSGPAMTDRVGRPGRPGARRRGPQGCRRVSGRRGPIHDARLAVHRTARFGPIQRGWRLRRRAAVRAGRVRRVPFVHDRARRQPPRHHHHPHRRIVNRYRCRTRIRTQVGAPPGTRPLAGADRRGRRPTHRSGRQRAAQGDRGAVQAHRSGCSARPRSKTSSSRSGRGAARCCCVRPRRRRSPDCWSSATASSPRSPLPQPRHRRDTSAGPVGSPRIPPPASGARDPRAAGVAARPR